MAKAERIVTIASVVVNFVLALNRPDIVLELLRVSPDKVDIGAQMPELRLASFVPPATRKLARLEIPIEAVGAH